MIEKTFDNWKLMIDAALDKVLPSPDTQPELLHKAMRYAVFPGGKRIRPLLVLSAAVTIDRLRKGTDTSVNDNNMTYSPKNLEGLFKRSMPSAVSIELIHSYSLIHDDLPSMDNDDYRRGLPAVHKAFGEAEAILAGDALISLAFEAVSGEGACELMGPEASVRIINEIAFASGSQGMVGGQVMDIAQVCPDTEIKYVERLSDLKTGALIRAAIRCGAIAAGANNKELAVLTRFGSLFGRAFQVRDDIKDIDEKGPFTFPAVLGEEEAALYGLELLSSAIDALQPYKRESTELLFLANAALRFS
ncbi:MAG: polyprenyl synthetase family protein [Firmicutes bacterium]|nr:polyprenyl synthetase family protein [Bacillota bacterium]